MSRKIPLWLPYLKEINESKGGVVSFVYKGGTEEIQLKRIDSIMIYGETEFKFKFSTLEKLTRAGIPIIYTRRNIVSPMIIHGGLRNDIKDTVTKQIIVRENIKKSTHIARMLLKAKMTSMKYLIEPEYLPKFSTIAELRNIEAKHAKKYWQKYFLYLEKPQWTRRGDDSSKNPVSDTLNAVSRFISSISLRWILYHNFSPSHGFLHVPTDYQSLVYDMVEPYRGIFEKDLLEMFKNSMHLQDKWIQMGINLVKERYNSKCYCPLTRQIITYHELLHGSVLSLKYYCFGEQKIFHIPLPGKPLGGRPAKIKFKMYGRTAGKTDFWAKASEVSKN